MGSSSCINQNQIYLNNEKKRTIELKLRHVVVDGKVEWAEVFDSNVKQKILSFLK